MTHRQLLERVLGALGETGIPYMLAGSFASAYHGVPRAIQDIDLVIAPTGQQLQWLGARFGMPDFSEHAAKLEWAREGQSERQIEDTAGILRVRAGELDLDHIDRWVR